MVQYERTIQAGRRFHSLGDRGEQGVEERATQEERESTPDSLTRRLDRLVPASATVPEPLLHHHVRSRSERRVYAEPGGGHPLCALVYLHLDLIGAATAMS